MLSLRLVGISSLLILTIGCGGGYSSSSTSSSPSPVPSPTPAPAGPSSSVVIPTGAESLADKAYAPDDVIVSVGDTVTWANTDSIAHTSTSNVSGWNSGTITPGGRFSFTFQKSGTFPYHCTIHPGMVGTVVVR
jgi:plastocyanin